ncbi:MAG: glutathione synthetase [Saprospirales bacterium]|nr:MAG: glutathione synthetase [Saprospirales bacterium]
MKILVLTDHRVHSAQNSVYDLMRSMQQLEPSSRIEVASRGLPKNLAFFRDYQSGMINVRKVTDNFRFGKDPSFFAHTYIKRELREYDWIILRLPRPIPDGFFEFLISEFDEDRIINRPSGIELTSNKLFLLNYPDLCPPIRHIKSMEDVIDFSRQFPIVLKPLKSYGGMGLIRVDGNRVWQENGESDWESLERKMEGDQGAEFLGMKYLSNVHMGDKRIMISNENILGATLRLPPENSWLCNVSQGGKSIDADLEEQELKIAHTLIPDMKKQGVILFGFDTLVGDDGVRCLSEINTLSLGGLAPADKSSNRPIIEMAARGIWDFIKEKSSL